MARNPKQPMPQEARLRQIIDQLEKDEHLLITVLSKQFMVSEITIRRDLDELESQGILFRTHGGAIRNKPISSLFSFDSKVKNRQKEKLEICRYAASLINEGDNILINCGTTVYYLARYISKLNNIRVITNSLPVVSELMQSPQIKVTLIGGELDHVRRALYGSTTESNLHRLRATKAFLGSAGISLANGFSSNDEKENIITATMAEVANICYVLCDSSKFEHDAYIAYAPITKAQMIITDNGIDPVILNRYKQANVNVVISESID
jgi:DeoR family fructose operon transcriptional repressor